jgi:hypothetical protein
VQPAGYVLRHYEVTPALNPESSTARITLYFTQAEFDAFNTQNAVKLPTGPSDAAGKANLLVEKRGGVSSDGSGSPFTYPGQPETINPADNNIVWNAIENRWEVTFDVTGFSGFFVKTTAGALPLRWLQVTARLNARQQAEISWQVSEKDVAGYTIESSSHGRSFAAIASIQGQGDGVHTYRFTEASTLQGEALYRIKQTDLKGGNNYSIVLKLNVGNRRQISVHPNPVMNNLVITVAPELINSTLKLTDVQGRVVMQTRITAQTTSIDVSRLGKGHYQINIGNEAAIRIMKQ